jgi:hypothetical protein
MPCTSDFMNIQKLKHLLIKAVPLFFMGMAAVYILDADGLLELNRQANYFVLCTSLSLFFLAGILSLRQKIAKLPIKDKSKIVHLKRRMKRFTGFMVIVAVLITVQSIFVNQTSIWFIVAMMPVWLLCYWINTLTVFLTAWGQSNGYDASENN